MMKNIFFPKLNLEVIKNNKNDPDLLKKVVGTQMLSYAVRWTMFTLILMMIALVMNFPDPSWIEIAFAIIYLITVTGCCSITLGMWWVYLATRTSTNSPSS